ncbi:acid protease [Roridomyces roridus]|uniref:Acid protease n=1 Tax=Roridomyces roridus TaxID=1738132 RepID=A0AAD7FF97_9AGAR|nr:acid protease [Roridomyces roridus]
MVPLTLFSLSLLAVSAGAVGGDRTHSHVIKRHVTPSTELETPSLPIASITAPIVSRQQRRPSKTHALRSLLASGSTADLFASDYGFDYLVSLTVGGQQFYAIADTGSSDTWVPQTGFQCFNLTGVHEPQSACAFGTTGFNTTRSKTFQAYPHTKFSIVYGDGEYLEGVAAFETVEVAGLTVTHQEIGVVSQAAWMGDGVNSGLLGLAYPALTSVVNSSNHDDPILYDPFFFNAVKQKKVSHPYFSVSLDRGADGPNSTHKHGTVPHFGYLAFGGIPPVPVTNLSVTLPVQGYSLSSRLPTSSSSSSTGYFYYTLPIQGFSINSNKTLLGANNNTILDTGTTLSLLPSSAARAFNAAFRPLAQWDLHTQTYYVPCNATAPSLGVKLGGRVFNTDPRDAVVWVGKDEKGHDVCVSGVQDAGGDAEDEGLVFILGDMFLHNVVSTFDIGQNRVTITQRKPY